MDFLKAIKEAKEKAKPRKFNQTFDLVINLKGLDLKKPENRINKEFILPEGRGKEQKVVLISNSATPEDKKLVDLVIDKAKLEKLGENKKEAKKIANEYDWFLAEASLMPLVGKNLGPILAPRGKMPKPIPPNAKLQIFVENAKKSVRIRVKTTPVIQVPVGTEKQEEEKVAKNAEAIYNFIKELLPKKELNIKSIFIKLTMGPAIKVE